MLFLYGSYNGLLLFENSIIYILWNPVTEEQTIVKKPSTVSTRGFFFNPKTREYKVLYVELLLGLSFQFTLYSLATRCSGKIAKCSHPPWVKAPVILNGALHWVVDRFYYERLYRRSLLFSESILLFDMNTETIRTMARPGDQYGTRVDNTYVHLLKKEGSLCFCDTSSYPSTNFWVLEDYAEEVWIKTHAINLEPLRPCSSDKPYYLRSAPNIENDELLLIWGWFLFRYNLKFNVFKKFKMGDEEKEGVIFNFVEHRNSLVTLRTD
ncbi:hypothetical protein IFM89_003239 [Coptis chinensis]|uniref:F-box associated beta-propeller type 3 domain-containing protein n=1 Tax=Coptis chinensis TaxID=261450 RepID=A0A835H495_9MAGN|nr:hypothetical protein IFM89_003239 [Coptis chinensis]